LFFLGSSLPTKFRLSFFFLVPPFFPPHFGLIPLIPRIGPFHLILLGSPMPGTSSFPSPAVLRKFQKRRIPGARPFPLSFPQPNFCSPPPPPPPQGSHFRKGVEETFFSYLMVGPLFGMFLIFRRLFADIDIPQKTNPTKKQPPSRFPVRFLRNIFDFFAGKPFPALKAVVPPGFPLLFPFFSFSGRTVGDFSSPFTFRKFLVVNVFFFQAAS